MKSCILYECLTPSPLNRPINPSHLAEVLPFYGILRFQSSLDPTSNRIPSVSQTGYCTPDQVEISFRDKSFGTYKIPTTYIKKWMPIILRSLADLLFLLVYLLEGGGVFWGNTCLSRWKTKINLQPYWPLDTAYSHQMKRKQVKKSATKDKDFTDTTTHLNVTPASSLVQVKCSM